MHQSRKWAFIFLIIFLTYPFWNLLINKGFTLISLAELIPVFIFTVNQAFWSSVFTLILGLIGAFSYLKTTSPKRRMALRLIYIFPVMIPIITVVTSFLELNFLLGFNVYNIIGIVFLHTMVYSGLVSLQVAQVFEDKLSKVSEVCWFYGVSFRKYLIDVAIPVTYKDLTKIFLFTFAIFFTSFSVPYFLTGTLNPTLELLILQKIQIYGDWGQALTYSCIQTLVIVGFTLILNSKKEANTHQGISNWNVLKGEYGFILNVLIFGLILLFLLIDIPTGMNTFLNMPELKGLFFSQLGYSLLLAILAFTGAFIILCLAAFAYPIRSLRKIIYAYMAPSSVIVGFSLLRFSITNYVLVTLLIAIGLIILLLPSLFRFQLGLKLEALQQQYEMAEVLGARPLLIFKKIIFPQVYGVILFLSALTAFWAFGDFSISVIVAPNDFTLSLMLKSLLSSYRLELASFYSLIILILGATLFFSLMGLGHVFGKKLNS